MSRPERCFVLAAVCTVATLPVTPASAVPPSTEVVPFDEIEVIEPGQGSPCSFAITIHHQGTFIMTTFFGRDGTPIRRLVRSGGHFTETYSANGRSLRTVSPVPVHVDLITGEVVATGNQRHVIVPGIGPVYAQAGRYVLDPSTGEITSFSGLDIPPGDELCDALSP
jgi:hypothetical protein